MPCISHKRAIWDVRRSKVPKDSFSPNHSGNNSSLCVLIAINGTWEAKQPQLSLAIRTSAPKMSTKKVIVMMLHAVLNRIHVSVTVHVERACSECICARGLYPLQLDYTIAYILK